MCDKPKLTIEAAFEEFPDVCRALFNARWRLDKTIEFWVSWSYCHNAEDVILRLICCALQFLEGKELVLLELKHKRSQRRIMPKDSLRWALEEVRGQMNRKEPGPDRVGQCWCCANNFPGCCPYEGNEFSPTPCDKWADAPLVTKPGE